MKEISMKQLIKALEKKHAYLTKHNEYEQACFLKIAANSLNNYLVSKQESKVKASTCYSTIRLPFMRED